MNLFTKIFKDKKPIIGMVHLKPLPGAYGYTSLIDVYKYALDDLRMVELMPLSSKTLVISLMQNTQILSPIHHSLIS